MFLNKEEVCLFGNLRAKQNLSLTRHHFQSKSLVVLSSKSIVLAPHFLHLPFSVEITDHAIPRFARLLVEQVEMQSAKQKEGGRVVEPEKATASAVVFVGIFCPRNFNE